MTLHLASSQAEIPKAVPQGRTIRLPELPPDIATTVDQLILDGHSRRSAILWLCREALAMEREAGPWAWRDVELEAERTRESVGTVVARRDEARGLIVDGRTVEGGVIPLVDDGRRHEVLVRW
jgi:hypothetical protein